MSAIKRENGGASAGNAAANSQTSTSEAQDKARSARKRTKTGCLTCRKRRIKCDEGKPICKNCQKSKRQCEGYNQRVVFKPADFQYLPHGGATITFDAGMVQDARGDTGDNNQSAAYPQRTAPQPRSLSVASQIHQPYQTLGDSLEQSQSPPLSQSRTYDASLHGMQQPVVSHFQQSPPLAGMPFSDHHASFQNSGQRDRNSQNPALLRTIPGRDSSYITQQFPPDEWQQNEQNEFGTVQWSSNLVPGDQVSPVTSQAWHERNTGYVSPPQRIPSIQHDYPMFDYETNMGRPQPMDHRKLSRAHSDCTNTYGGNTNTVRVDNDFTTPETLHPELGDTAHLDSAAIEIHDDDYYDVDTEDEMYDMDNEFDAQDLQEQRQCGYDQRNPSGYSLSASKMDARNFDSFVFSGILDTYRPEQVANPLKNPATARVFAHFVSETAAVLTTSPRQTWKANAFAGNKSFPMSKHCIWTYDMPMAALHHQALLQSMLAISSLQIAKVQGASETPSLKHYAYALKRIHHCVGNLKKRLSVPTLAASLLLGYYEVMAANHANWQSHLTGARQLMVEIDFAGMTKMFKRMKFDKAKTDQRLPRYQSSSIPQLPDDQSPEDLILDQMYEADENVVSRICGIRVSYARYGHVGEGNVAPQSSNLERYDALRDLYWWYCKQDVYHSLISGDPLMMDYSRFTDCPPRASLSKADALYGSFDHLVLLLARIADFASKDRKRKIKASHIAGSSPSTQARSTSGPRSSASPNQHSVSPTHMPYPPGVSHSPASTTSHDFADLGAATANALQEWESIRDALNFFVSSLGPHFQPLDAEFQQSVPTPYGLAVFYRSWDLSVFWTVYNMAMIAAHRFHPHMPPAAHVAAAAAAEQTREHALQIGRIAAGIMLPPPESPLDPRMGAAMVDMVVPLFFAGVQYTQPDHRQWHVERLFETNRRVGWATAGIIAEGCQSGWIRAAEAGRGPPHVRVRKATFSDFRIGRYGDWSAVEKNRLSELDAENDRKFVRTKASARVHWAIGLMGTEEDVNEDSE